jgi:hypothetical protein
VTRMVAIDSPLLGRQIVGPADQKLDFAVKDDVVTFRGGGGADENAPRILLIAGRIPNAIFLAAGPGRQPVLLAVIWMLT